MTQLEQARAVADAVLYEGYLLYPYRADAPKNQVRWQWGVLMPAVVVEHDSSERSGLRTELLVDGPATRVRLHIRFLQVVRRTVEDESGVAVARLDTGDAVHVPFDEAKPIECEHEVDLDGTGVKTFTIPAEHSTAAVPGGRLVHSSESVSFSVRTRVQPVDGPSPLFKLSIHVDNTTEAVTAGDRAEWLRRALVACHLLVEVETARFLSAMDPPEWAADQIAALAHEGTFPVLASPDDRIVLASPIILPEHPELAAESESNFFDGLEIDELLSLRTMTLTDEEKRLARGTDPRAAALLDEVETIGPELWDRLHGSLKYLDTMAPKGDERAAPWWDPGADASVDPENDAVLIGEVEVRRGSRVMLRPGARSADAYDLFLAGRSATVAAVLHDVDGRDHLAVTVDDDPGADIMAGHGRYLYFAPDEVEPIAQSAGAKP